MWNSCEGAVNDGRCSLGGWSVTVWESSDVRVTSGGEWPEVHGLDSWHSPPPRSGFQTLLHITRWAVERRRNRGRDGGPGPCGRQCGEDGTGAHQGRADRTEALQGGADGPGAHLGGAEGTGAHQGRADRTEAPQGGADGPGAHQGQADGTVTLLGGAGDWSPPGPSRQDRKPPGQSRWTWNPPGRNRRSQEPPERADWTDLPESTCTHRRTKTNNTGRAETDNTGRTETDNTGRAFLVSGAVAEQVRDSQTTSVAVTGQDEESQAAFTAVTGQDMES